MAIGTLWTVDNSLIILLNLDSDPTLQVQFLTFPGNNSVDLYWSHEAAARFLKPTVGCVMATGML